MNQSKKITKLKCTNYKTGAQYPGAQDQASGSLAGIISKMIAPGDRYSGKLMKRETKQTCIS